jgi:hypothetical protein
VRLRTRGTVGGHGGLTPPAAGSGTTQQPVPLLVGWARHTLIHPGAWNRCSSTLGGTLLWIVLPNTCAQPALICASVSLKDPEAAPPSERSPPKTSIKRVPWFLSSPSPLSPQIRSTPLGSHHRHGRRRACPDHRSRTPFHKVVTEVTTVTLPEASRTTPD